MAQVEWEMWTSSNDGCGPACESQGAFKRSFKETATLLEKVGPVCGALCTCRCQRYAAAWRCSRRPSLPTAPFESSSLDSLPTMKGREALRSAAACPSGASTQTLCHPALPCVSCGQTPLHAA